MSAPQKLRQRRRLRRVDNIVTVLGNALQRQAASSVQSPSASSRKQPSKLPNDASHQRGASSKATPEELSTTAEGQRMLDAATHSDQEARRHGRGPRQGEMVPEKTAAAVRVPSRKSLGDQARLSNTIKLIERWKTEMPTEQEMLPRDKYTMFDRKARGYRKGVHKLPKWTRISQRLNPPGF